MSPGLRGCSIGHGLMPAAAKEGAPSDAIRLGSAGGWRLLRCPLLLSLACHRRLRLLLLLLQLCLRPLPPADLLLLPACPQAHHSIQCGLQGTGMGLWVYACLHRQLDLNTQENAVHHFPGCSMTDEPISAS